MIKHLKLIYNKKKYYYVRNYICQLWHNGCDRTT